MTAGDEMTIRIALSGVDRCIGSQSVRLLNPHVTSNAMVRNAQSLEPDVVTSLGQGCSSDPARYRLKWPLVPFPGLATLQVLVPSQTTFTFVATHG
jgi:hypothetical protein